MRMIQLIIGGIIILSATGISAAVAEEETCFWRLPGVTYLLDSNDFYIGFEDTSFCKNIPRYFLHKDVSKYGGDLSGVLLMVTQKDELQISFSPSLFCPVSVGSRCSKMFTNPITITLPDVDVSQITGTAVVTVQAATYHPEQDNPASVIIAVNNGATELLFAEILLYRLEYPVAEFTVGTILRYSLKELKDGQEILGIDSMKNTDSIIVYGTKGLLRTVAFSEIISENNQDVASSDDLVCAGGGYVGSADGSIYLIGEKQPVAEIGMPLQTVSEEGAGGDNGLIVEHRGTEWNVFNVDSLSVRHCNFLNTTRGREVLIVDEQYQLYKILLYDSPTTFTVNELSGLAPYINGHPFIYNGLDTLSVSCTASDPEGNIRLPEVTLRTGDTVLQIRGTLYGNTFSLSFTGDSATVTGKSLLILTDDVGPYETFGPPCTTSVAWNKYDTVVIATKIESLGIVNNNYVAVEKSQKQRGATINLYSIANRIIADVQRGVNPIAVRKKLDYKIYSCQGKILRGNKLNRGLSQGMYILCISSVNEMVVKSFYMMR